MPNVNPPWTIALTSTRGCPLSLRIIMGETAGLEDYGAQLGDTLTAS
jgi:hypothetical protein